MVRSCLVLSFIISSFNINAQQISEISAHKVYNQIVDAIGNTNPREPELFLKNSKRNPASYSPKKKTITLENKVLEICYSFGKDSLNALSYILAHELGHHYKDHGWTTQYASLDFSNEIDKKQESAQQRVDDETQADIYAGFYAHIAGYDALSVADQFLDRIYKEYDLPDSLANYPTLIQRKKVINKNRSDFDKLKIVFDVANISMSVGQYDYAQELFSYILDKGFTSREIYNNLGLCYVYEALALDVEGSYFNVIIPFKIDLSSRLETKGTSRGAMTAEQKAISLFKDAKREFETALELDPNYLLAKENSYYSNIALAHLGEKQKFDIDIEDMLSLDNVCEFCIKGHKSVIDDDLKKAKSDFKKGSKICDICSINIDFKNKQIPEKKRKEKTVFDDLTFNGVDMYCKDFKVKDCDIYQKLTSLTLGVKQLPDLKLIKLKRKIKGVTSCVSIQEVSVADDKLKNNVEVYIGDAIDKILDNYQNLRIVNSADSKYISIVDEQLTFLIEDEKVSKWYYFERLD